MENQPAATARALASEPGVWYECSQGERKLRIHFSPDVIGRLQRESVAALRGAGREIGGILLGSIQPDANGQAISIERAETVDCRNPRDGSYSLNAEGRDRFAAAALLCGMESNAVVLGFFRSQTRPDLRLYEEDAALTGACFDQPVPLIVLLKPLESGLCTAGLFFRGPGDRWPEFCDLEIPFFDPNAADVAIRLAPTLFAVTAPDIPADLSHAGERAGEPATAALPTPHPPGASIRKRPAGPGRLLQTAALTVMAGLLVFLVAFWTPYLIQRWRLLALSAPPAVVPVVQRQPLDLQVSSQNDRLIVTWNRDAPALRTARRGLLEVQDGPQRKQLDLDSAELTGGSLVYLPATGDVLFRLEVSIDDTHTTAESVRFLSGRTGTDATASILLSQTTQPVAPPTRTAASLPARASAPPARAWEAPHVPAATPAPTAIPDPPRLKAAESAATPALPNHTLAPPPSPQTPRPARPQPVQAPASEPLRVAHYAPPKVIREVPVSVPPNVRTMLTGTTSVEVRVTIDPRGRVIRTDVVSVKGAVAHLLAASAMEAARLYRFTPAQLDGVPTRSEMVISFRFAR